MQNLNANKFSPAIIPPDVESHLTRQKAFAVDVFGAMLHDQKMIKDKYNSLAKGLTQADIVRKVNKIYHCSDMIELREDTQTGKVRVSNARYCKQPLVCSMCSGRTQAVRRKKYDEPLKNAIKNYRYVYLLTLTIKDVERLDNGLDILRSGIRSFVRMGQRRKKRFMRGGVPVVEVTSSEGEFGKVKAGFFSIEVKRGEDSGLWHPHAHGLFFTNEMFDFVVYDPALKKELMKQYGKDIPKEELDKIALDPINKTSKISREWIAATQGAGVSIEVSPVTTAGGSIMKQCKEVIKYTSLLNPHKPDDAIEIISNTYGKRFFSTYGEFRKVNVDDYEDLEKKPDEKIYYAVWNAETRRYGRANPAHGTMFETEIMEKRKRLLGEQARMLGICRRNRRALLDSYHGNTPGEWEQLEAALDGESSRFRTACQALWQDFHEYEYQRPEPDPVQIDLFTGIPEPEDESWRNIEDSWRLPQYR